MKSGTYRLAPLEHAPSLGDPGGVAHPCRQPTSFSSFTSSCSSSFGGFQRGALPECSGELVDELPGQWSVFLWVGAVGGWTGPCMDGMGEWVRKVDGWTG